MEKSSKIGLFFGSFNPIHTGHLIIASHIVSYTEIQQLWFIVSPQNPFKKKDMLLADHHRIAMVRLAIEDDNRFRASDVEFKLPQPSFTINTLSVLTEKYPEIEFYLIMGSDNLLNFGKWRNAEIILRDYKLIVYPRPGSDGGSLSKHPSIQWVNAPLMQISSSFIRQAIAEKKDIRYLTTPKVHDYLHEMHFYEKKSRSFKP